MHLDVLDLRNFYYRTNLGRVAQRAIRNQLLEFWPEAKNQTVVGFGFAVPMLRPYMEEARRIVGVMPGQQGVMHWPAGRPNVSVLSEEVNWPLATGIADKLVVMHGLETSEHPTALLEECSRVMGPGARAMFIVPNRSGLWARGDGTPFGFGRPYSLGQLENQLKRHGFQPEGHRAALYAPPSHKRFWLKTSDLLEGMGRRVSAYFAGGVLMVEVSKQVYRPTGTPVTNALRRPLSVLPAPAANPV